jgi:hypothetical protein
MLVIVGRLTGVSVSPRSAATLYCFYARADLGVDLGADLGADRGARAGPSAGVACILIKLGGFAAISIVYVI